MFLLNEVGPECFKRHRIVLAVREHALSISEDGLVVTYAAKINEEDYGVTITRIDPRIGPYPMAERLCIAVRVILQKAARVGDDSIMGRLNGVPCPFP